MNGRLKNYVKGPKDAILQVFSKFSLVHELNNTNLKKIGDVKCTIFCEKMLNSGVQHLSTGIVFLFKF